MKKKDPNAPIPELLTVAELAEVEKWFGVDSRKMLESRYADAAAKVTGVHVSDINNFLSCRRKWGWNSPLRDNLRSVHPYLPFVLGRIVHEALEFYYLDGTDVFEQLEEAFANEVAKHEIRPDQEAVLAEQYELAEAMLDHYLQWINSPAHQDKIWSDANIEVIEPEVDFKVPIKHPDGTVFQGALYGGRFDGLCRLKHDGSLWILEHKTAAQPSQLIASLPLQMQAVAYTYAARQMGYDVQGVLYNVIRKKACPIPSLLKNGTLSQRANADITPEWFMAIARLTHEDLDDVEIAQKYMGYLGTLAARDNKYFQRIFVRRSPEVVSEWQQQMWDIVTDMTNPNLPLYPSASQNCSRCFFKEACLSKNEGRRYDLILSSDFTNRDTYYA